MNVLESNDMGKIPIPVKRSKPVDIKPEIDLVCKMFVTPTKRGDAENTT